MKPASRVGGRLLTVADVTERLRVSDKTVRRLINDQKLRVHHVGRRLLISEEDLALFLASRRT